MIIVYHCSDSTPIKIVAGCQTHRPPPHRPLHWVSSCFWDCNAVEFFLATFMKSIGFWFLGRSIWKQTAFEKRNGSSVCVLQSDWQVSDFHKRPKISVFLKNGSRLPPSGLLLWLQLGRLLFLLFWGDSAINCDSILKPFPSCPGRPVCTDQYSICYLWFFLTFQEPSAKRCQQLLFYQIIVQVRSCLAICILIFCWNLA